MTYDELYSLLLIWGGGVAGFLIGSWLFGWWEGR